MSWRDDMWANWFGWTLSSTLIRAAAVAVCSSHKQTGTRKSNECNLKLVFFPPMRQANTYWTVQKTAIWDWYPLCLWCCCILPSIIFIVAVLFCFFALDSQRVQVSAGHHHIMFQISLKSRFPDNRPVHTRLQTTDFQDTQTMCSSVNGWKRSI